jgi:membrane protein implicated in regulation of membrane protease activity
MLGLCTAVLVFAALYFARSILAPVAFSLFVVAIVWLLQRALETRIPMPAPRAMATMSALLGRLTPSPSPVRLQRWRRMRGCATWRAAAETARERKLCGEKS